MDIFTFLKKHFEQVVMDTLGYPEKDFEIIKIHLETSNLYEEYKVLLSHQKKMGFFQEAHSLEEFKFDPVNNCGVVHRLMGDKNHTKVLIRSFGNEHVLHEKKWI